jgi:hypothetical protein
MSDHPQHSPLDHEREKKESSHSSHHTKEEAHGLGDSTLQETIVVEQRDDLGAGKSEAVAKVWGKYSIWVLYIR